MLNKYPFSSIIYSILLLRMLLSLTRRNWLYIWLLLELNILCFIPIIISKYSAQQLEASVKYFLAQALGSNLLIIYRFSIWYLSPVSNIASTLLITGLIIKLGIAPFHYWYPSVISSINWLTCLFLSTVQKIVPLFLLIVHHSKLLILLMVALSSALIGRIIGINQSKLRSIIAYSSIAHLGWITSMIYFNFILPPIIYFILYSIIITPLFIIFNIINSLYISFINKSSNVSINHQIYIIIALLSLSGIPPLTGFFPKWITIRLLFDKTWIIVVLIIRSIISIYFYLSLVFASSINQQLITSNNRQKKYNLTILCIVSIITIFIFPIILTYAMTIFYKS